MSIHLSKETGTVGKPGPRNNQTEEKGTASLCGPQEEDSTSHCDDKTPSTDLSADYSVYASENKKADNSTVLMTSTQLSPH